MQILVNKVPINYRIDGEGKTLLLLHGWRDSLSTYDALAAELQDRYRIVRLDLPNFGQSGNSETIITTHDYADFVAAFIKKVDLGPLSALIGHSMGGQIAIYALAHEIVMADSLVLLAAAAIRNEGQVRKALLKTAAKVAKPLLGSKVKQKIYRRLDSDYDPRLSPTLRAVLTSALERDVQKEARELQIPTLLVYGQNDSATPARHGSRLAQLIPDARLETVIAGHHLHQERAEQIANIIEDFVG